MNMRPANRDPPFFNSNPTGLTFTERSAIALKSTPTGLTSLDAVPAKLTFTEPETRHSLKPTLTGLTFME